MFIPQQPIIMDTNILLDCFVFNDAATMQLKGLLMSQQLQWLATQSMEEEYLRVLNYPTVLRWFDKTGQTQMNHLDGVFAQYARRVDEAPEYKNFLCRDRDDQKFVNLAIEHKTILLSKDKAVLRMASKLKVKEVIVSATFNF